MPDEKMGKERKKTLHAIAEQQEIAKEKQDASLKGIARLWREAKARKELRNFAIFAGLLSAAVAGRVALQYVPSVEPIIPFAVLAGLLLGVKEGFTVGGAAYIISNFFIWGLQGPWTVFQAIGAAFPGAFAGIFGKIKKPGTWDLIWISLAGTIFFEIVMNISGAFMGIGLLGAFSILAIPLYFATSLPFSITHIVTNVIFARALAPLLKLRRQEDEFKIVSYIRHNPDGTSANLRVYKAE